MKFLSCFGSFLLLVNISTGQSFGPDQTNDSLWGVWTNDLKHNTLRLATINSYLRMQPDSAFYFAQLQYNFAAGRG